MRDLAFLIVLLALVPIMAQSPLVGVLFWAWTAILAPNQFLYGFLSSVQFGKIIALLTIAMVIFSRERKNFRLDRTLVVMGCLLLSGTVSAYTSIDDNALNWELYGKLAKILLFAYVISAVMGTRVRIHALVFAICLALGFAGSTEALMYIATAGGHIILGSSSLGDNNSFALAMLVVVPLMYYLVRYSSNVFVRLGWTIGIILSLVSVVATFSRGGFIGMAVLAGCAILNSRRKILGLAAVGVACVLVFALAPPAWFQRIDSIGSAGDDGSFMGRVIAWKMSVLVALDHPLFGGGFHAIQNLPVWLSYQGVFHILSFVATDPPGNNAIAAHSIYFEVLGDLGFLGLLLFLSLLAISFLNVRTIKRLTKHRPDLAWAYDLATMLQLGLIVYCVSGAALSMAYFELLYIELAILARMRVMLMAEQSRKPVPARLPGRGRTAEANPQLL